MSDVPSDRSVEDASALARTLSNLRQALPDDDDALSKRLGMTVTRLQQVLSGEASPSASELAVLAGAFREVGHSELAAAEAGYQPGFTDAAPAGSFEHGPITSTPSSEIGASESAVNRPPIEAFHDDLQMARTFALLKNETDRQFLLFLAGLMARR